jgi:tRNA modification GTPase
VGKSSLLNLLLAEERAIVTPVPGTTRDVIEEVVNIRGLPVRLMDTAGLRETADHVESIGVERARERVRTADLVLFVVDTTEQDFSEDLSLLDCAAGKKTIVVANKSDLSGAAGAERVRTTFEGYGTVVLSALEGTGAGELKDAVFREVTGREHRGPQPAPVGSLVVSARHRDSLEKALEGLGRVGEALGLSMPGEFVATDLRWAVDRLGEITGETTTEDILDRIFSDFCIGK